MSSLSDKVEAAVRERDALATELQERYPVLATELADLLRRIEANEQHLNPLRDEAGARPLSADKLVRGLPGNSDVLPLARAVKLPALNNVDALHGRMLWPLPTPIPIFRG